MRFVLMICFLLSFGRVLPLQAAEKTPSATETWALAFGLRGGYDSNPADGPVARGSAFSTEAISYQYLNGTKEDGVGFSFSSTNTYFDPRVVAATLNNAASLNVATRLDDHLVLRGTLDASNAQTWSRRENAALVRSRLDYEMGSFRLFASLEGRVAALNERNYFALGAFLPRDENSGTLTVLPGIAYKVGAGEAGLSLTASHTSYLEDFDYLGFRRDNNRLQPNLFFNGKIGPATVQASLSALNAYFPDRDFAGLHRLLFSAKASLPLGSLTAEVASSRTAQDTTLPFSAIDIVDLHEARLTAQLGARQKLSVFARLKSDDYTGLEARATTRSIGLEYGYSFASGYTATAAVSLRRIRETGVKVPDGLNIQFGLQKSFAARPAG